MVYDHVETSISAALDIETALMDFRWTYMEMLCLTWVHQSMNLRNQNTEVVFSSDNNLCDYSHIKCGNKYFAGGVHSTVVVLYTLLWDIGTVWMNCATTYW